jgi:hypothetical protein
VPIELLDSNAFREIARLVDVAARLDGEMVGELQRNDGEDRADESGTLGTVTMSSAMRFSCFAQLPEVMGDRRAFR